MILISIIIIITVVSNNNSVLKYKIDRTNRKSEGYFIKK